jgi:hypothetical protein
MVRSVFGEQVAELVFFGKKQTSIAQTTIAKKKGLIADVAKRSGIDISKKTYKML